MGEIWDERRRMVPESTYEDIRRAIKDEHDDNGGKWPSWLPFALSIAAVIVSVTLAYAALDKRISLMEQKLDYLVQQSTR